MVSTNKYMPIGYIYQKTRSLLGGRGGVGGGGPGRRAQDSDPETMHIHRLHVPVLKKDVLISAPLVYSAHLFISRVGVYFYYDRAGCLIPTRQHMIYPEK